MKIRILPDPDCEKPFLNFQVCYLFRSRYQLGNEAVTPERMKEIEQGIASGEIVGLPVKAYVHGCTYMTADPITASRWPYDCPWDAGQSGFVYLPKGMVKKALSVSRLTAKQLRRAHEMMIAEVKLLSQWLSGDCYGYKIEDEEGNELDSCWGFIGRDFVEESAKEALEALKEKSA